MARLENRSSAANTLRQKQPKLHEEMVIGLRLCFLRAARLITKVLELPRSTVVVELNRHRVGQLKYLVPKEPVRRYERTVPGNLLHLDIKKLAKFDRVGPRVTGNRRVKSRGAQWEFVHVCVDDYSRLAHVEVLKDKEGETASTFLERETECFQNLGITVNQVMTDNGAGYRSKVFRKTCERFDIRPLRTRPYRPQTNGKAERFIQTLTRRWAHGRAFRPSDERKGLLPLWLSYYNHQRKHVSLDRRPPITWLTV